MTRYGSHDPANPYLSHDPALHGELRLEEDRAESIRAYLALDRADPHASRFWEYGGEMDQISAIKDLASQPISNEIGVFGEGPREAAGMVSGLGIPGEGRGDPDFAGWLGLPSRPRSSERGMFGEGPGEAAGMVSGLGIPGEGPSYPDFAGGVVDLFGRASRLLGGAKFAHLESLGLKLDDVTPSAEQASGATQGLGDKVHELDEGVGSLGGTVDLATLGMDGMSASMGVGRQEALALAGDLGTLEEQAQATRDAFNRGVAVPWAPTRSATSNGGWGPPAGGGADADLTRPDSIKEARARFLASPPPANLQEIYLDQFRQGHDMSGFRDARHWWGEHLKHMARLKYGYAQGTSFAPGGLALVGEMGPELVNLPRGSQVIPNPQLGSEVTVNVNVEGSVVAERDLAQRIRQELIRTSRRTVDLGFVA